MDFLTLAKERFSVRSFQSKPVEQEKIDLILKAAQLAPTAVNYQPQMIYLLKSEEALDKISALAPTYEAPMVFLICADENRTWKSKMEPGYSTGEMDATIVTTHMMLEAWELGIGSVWVRLFDSRKVANAFNLQENIKPICLLPIGYAAENCVPYAPWHNVYRPIEDFTITL
ncbi:MAG: nitroreductase family protein [Selenomonadaceae bacterium]|nr:nitroreductase family protein [Selenomonadaceae bacterium]MBR1859234.1 nitroreductase family protein [Selenomonadaceae bacterium]